MIHKHGIVKHPNRSTPKFLANASSIGAALEADCLKGKGSQTQPIRSSGPLAKPSVAPQRPASQKRTRKALDLFASKLDTLESVKAQVAAIASQIVANPEAKISLLNDIRQLSRKHKGHISAIIILTEAQLYKDIAPAYRIRLISEKEAETKVSKDVARLRTFEQSLLNHYKRFISSCISHSRWRPGHSILTPAARQMAALRNAACKALAELLRSLPHFNEAHVIANAVCALVLDREESLRKESAQALKDVLGDAHRASGQTLDICVLIAKNLATSAAGKLRAAPEEVVAPLVNIQFSSFALLPPSKKAKNEQKKSKRFIKKRRRKPITDDQEAAETELERDLREGDAEASSQELHAAKKNLLDSVCHAYFNIIRAAAASYRVGDSSMDEKLGRKRKPPPALAAALKGLLRVSVYININIIEAILAALTPLLEQGRLPLATQFRCLSAGYAVLGVHARSQKVDPNSFTGDVRAIDCALYSALGSLYTKETPLKDEEYITFDAIETILSATSFRQIPSSRSCSMARRLSVLATSAPTHACTIGLLHASQLLLPPALVSPIFLQKGDDATGMGDATGLIQDFDMSANDPEIANAERSAAWEFSCAMSHFHPAVRQIAEVCASGVCGTALPNSGNILVFTKEHSSAQGGFNPAPQDIFEKKHSKKLKSQGSDMLHDKVLINAIQSEEERKMFLEENDDIALEFFASQWKDV